MQDVKCVSDLKFRENLPNSQKFRGPAQSGRSQGSQQKIIRFVKNQLHILMQSHTQNQYIQFFRVCDCIKICS